jgi:phage/plasmid-like protein (TIGR03299 family)
MYTISQNTNIESLLILEQAGLNWTARKETLQTANGIITDHIAVIREDDDTVLGVHKNGYEIFQNQQLAELVFELSNKISLPIHNAGQLANGRKVFIQLKSDTLNFNNDSVEGYLTAVNSFDGSTSLAFGHSSITISCQNKFFGAYRNLDNKVKHTKSMTIKIEDILKTADNVITEEKENFATIKRLAEAPITNNWVDDILKGLFKTSLNDVKTNEDKISTRTKNNIARFNDALAIELNGKGDNLWGLFSGMTRYTTHMIGDNKEDTKMFGTVAKTERMIFDKMSELVA